MMSPEAEENAQMLHHQMDDQSQQQQTLAPMPQPLHLLPTPRAFLTDLLSSLPGPRAHAATTTTRGGALGAANVSTAPTTNANPLRDLHSKDRNVFLTLHVLFPNELLPALDLLDRGLVTRFAVVDGGETKSTSAAPAPAEASGPDRQGDNAANDAERCSQPAEQTTTTTTTAPPPPPPLQPSAARSPLYYVRSAQQQQQQRHFHRNRSRYGHSRLGVDDDDGDDDAGDDDADASSAEKWYEVRLVAWSCSCPAFAFAAFPANLREPSPSPPPVAVAGERSGGEAEGKRGGEWVDRGVSNESVGDDGAMGEGFWERFGFGGLRRGGGVGQVPPVCKHLLACLLVERAPELLGGCAEERAVSVEEAAAWAAGWGG